ncbi:MAG: flagellar biosynthetic protein FliR [Tepidisphaeraceae bacterium]
MYDDLFHHVPTFVLVFFRLTGMMIFAPMFGSQNIPKRLKVLMASVLALGVMPGIAAPPTIPDSSWEVTLAIGGEMVFGIAMGMVLSFVFIAAQWAGEMIGQQMGINLSEVFDPQFGQGGSLIGGMYFMLTLVVFLCPPINGHHAMLRGVRASFDALPLLSLGVNRPLFDTIIGFFTAATMLAFQLAAPMLVTMVVVDLALGFIGKTMPQLNIMTMGLSLRAVIGMVVLVIGLMLTAHVISRSLASSLESVGGMWKTAFQ